MKVVPYQAKLTSENIMEILKDYDLVIDGCDNFPTRYLVNDACVLAGKPNVHGSIFQFEGQATVFIRDSSATASPPSRHRRKWRRAAPKPASWACCLD